MSRFNIFRELMADSLVDEPIIPSSAQKKNMVKERLAQQLERTKDCQVLRQKVNLDLANYVAQRATRTVDALRIMSTSIHTMECMDLLRMIKCLNNLQESLTAVLRSDFPLWTHLGNVNAALALLEIGDEYSDDVTESLRKGTHCILLLCKCIYDLLNSTDSSVSPKNGRDLLKFKNHITNILNNNSTFQSDRYFNSFIKATFKNIFISISSKLPSDLETENLDDSNIEADDVDDIDFIEFDDIEIDSESESEE